MLDDKFEFRIEPPGGCRQSFVDLVRTCPNDRNLASNWRPIKTSLVSAVGAKFGMSIYVVNLTELNDRTLKKTMNSVPESSIILFEDIDCMKAGNRRREIE